MARYISGIIMAACVVVLLGFAPAWACQAVVVVLAILAADEYARLTLNKARPAERFLAVFAVLAVVMSFVLHPGLAGPLKVAAVWFSLVVVVYMLFYMFGTFDIHQAWPRLSFGIFGVVYVGLPLGMLAFFVTQPRVYIFWILAVTALADTVAYVFGRTFGGKKMAPRLSPGKTWAGFCGSLVGGALASVAVVKVEEILFPEVVRAVTPYVWLIFFGAVVAVFGVLGDLAESFLKRAVGVKDSGNLIPGHGGILDRIDAFLFTTPAALFLLYVMLNNSI